MNSNKRYYLRNTLTGIGNELPTPKNMNNFNFFHYRWDYFCCRAKNKSLLISCSPWILPVLLILALFLLEQVLPISIRVAIIKSLLKEVWSNEQTDLDKMHTERRCWIKYMLDILPPIICSTAFCNINNLGI